MINANRYWFYRIRYIATQRGEPVHITARLYVNKLIKEIEFLECEAFERQMKKACEQEGKAWPSSIKH